MTTDQFVDGGWSDSGYHNPEYDQMYLDQQLLVDDKERQAVIGRCRKWSTMTDHTSSNIKKICFRLTVQICLRD
jgi:hypothetical protein